MIVGEQKPFDEIWDMIKDYKKVLVFGCNTCVAICHAGGGKEAEILASLLKMKATQEGAAIEISHSAIERHCEPEFFQPSMEDVRKYDLVLSTACGVGVNLLSEIIGEIPVFPAINTEFFGAVPRAGEFEEHCAGCGNCILHLTGGICPIARCSKSLLNGPCGGTNNGSCEISPDIKCAWVQIYDRLKALNRLDVMKQINEAKDWSTSQGPRNIKVKLMEENTK
ncbi:hypothetical protein BMS3Abin09_00838 [bacterium BMS3Abin09]|nr:hypothetical protein BMS3Abin09_00838 [bacterium BMS3Abin09]GBE41226.1 hypothetical protein BMS3Bbin09_01117 [bacterium BMS3Bbin09]HDN94795.1 hypothetical protein [Nitrospirota bacterium]